MDDAEPRLVILRGNSGAGKTTLAAALQDALGRGTANVGQDHLRRVVLAELVRWHTGSSNVFYVEVELEQTLARHEGRPLRSVVPPQSLRDWFVPHDVLGLSGEVVIDGSGTVDATLAQILASIGPTIARRSPPQPASSEASGPG